MTMSIARLSAQSGLKYLFKTTMMDDVSPAPLNATAYYVKAGTPQGYWLGKGPTGVNRTSREPVTETDAKAIFDHVTHLDTGAPLGRPHGQPTVVETKQGQTEMLAWLREGATKGEFPHVVWGKGKIIFTSGHLKEIAEMREVRATATPTSTPRMIGTRARSQQRIS
ncbi:relaxase domain-containing protein [Arthrobacter bambusae]|uniref:relaxase domain-containing protein n=1 Tax=Arthrobacter bambusae TaxID=1338426 RepID=UPI002789FE41|nr:relaxase domain-containing protein [Arthrobacter bambusae]MDQ0028797.1 hypothetical protein [Arthrobacter bambusae]MDQ0096409.1 hypothetical protein [Arthrobacter bambusae]